jgi:hypothetical protein
MGQKKFEEGRRYVDAYGEYIDRDYLCRPLEASIHQRLVHPAPRSSLPGPDRNLDQIYGFGVSMVYAAMGIGSAGVCIPHTSSRH